MDGWTWNGTSSRVIARGQKRKQVEEQVASMKRSGYLPLMDIKEEIDTWGRSYFVCVMEHPELKKKLAQRNNPSK